MSAAADTDGSGFKSQGAHHQAQNGIAQKSQVPAQDPPTQEHDRDMGTTQNTAAIYVRRSAFDADNEEADAFSRSIARCLVPGVTREELPDHFSS